MRFLIIHGLVLRQSLISVLGGNSLRSIGAYSAVSVRRSQCLADGGPRSAARCDGHRLGGARSPRAVSAHHRAQPAMMAGSDGVPGMTAAAMSATAAAGRCGRPAGGRPRRTRPGSVTARQPGAAGPASGGPGDRRGRVPGPAGRRDRRRRRGRRGPRASPGRAELGVGGGGGRVGGGVAAVGRGRGGSRAAMARHAARTCSSVRSGTGGQAEGGERVHGSPPGRAEHVIQGAGRRHRRGTAPCAGRRSGGRAPGRARDAAAGPRWPAEAGRLPAAAGRVWAGDLDERGRAARM